MQGWTRILCAVLVINNASAASLIDIYTSALNSSPKLRAANNNYMAAGEQKKIQRAALMPKMEFDGIIGESSVKTEVLSKNPLLASVNNVDHIKNRGYVVSITQPIANISALHDLNGSKLQIRLAELAAESERQSLIITVADAYLSVIKSWYKLDNAKSSLNFYELQTKISNKKYSLGLVRLTDVLQTQAALESAAAEKILAENELVISFNVMNEIAGFTYSDISGLSKDFKVDPTALQNPSDWQSIAVENNISYRIAKIQKNLAYENYLAMRAEHLPKVSANVSFSDDKSWDRYSYALPDTSYRNGLSGSVTLYVPLYSGGQISAASRQANYLYLEKIDQCNDLHRHILQVSQTMYLDVSTGEKAVNARKKAIEANMNSLLFEKKAYEKGVGNISDLLNAQKSLSLANLSYADAVYNYLMSGFKLKEIAGILSDDDISNLEKFLSKSEVISLTSLFSQ